MSLPACFFPGFRINSFCPHLPQRLSIAVIVVMKNTLKAVLLSGLGFPGLGHMAIKSYKRGAALMALTLVFLVAFVMKATQMAMTILEKIQAEGGAMDMDAISAAASRSTEASGNFAMTFFLFLIAACWVYGVIDAFRLGRKKDLEAESGQA